MRKIMGTGKLGLAGITAIAVLVSILLIGGCATTSMEKRENATMTMEEVEGDIRLLLLELSSTNSALASMVNPLQNDLPAAFEVFGESNDSLEKASRQFIERTRKMGVEGREYSKEWRVQEDTYTNPKIQELSEQRRSDLGAVYAQIADSSVGIEGELQQYVTDVQEVETYFSTDLTAGGVQAISDLANRTILDGFELSVKLRELLESVEKARAELSPEKTAAVE